MKVSGLYIRDYNQFKDFWLDLCYPEDHPDPAKRGQALEKVCFIGSNGTGKTQLLRIILNNLFHETRYKQFPPAPIFRIDGKDFYLSADNPFELPQAPQGRKGLPATQIDENTKIDPRQDLIVFSPAEARQNDLVTLTDVPETSLNEALENEKVTQWFHSVSEESAKAFWTRLIYLENLREAQFKEWQNLPENQERTVREVREDFDKDHPKILEQLAGIWNEILEKAGLYFDYEQAKRPIQLTDNLQAYIHLRSTGEKIAYNQLSTGIRNFIFRIGHIYSLFFEREIRNAFVLVDEPENSLFPDFLYGLIDIYQRICPGAQLFFATHNPILAAQFDPAERILLEWTDEGTVKARRGLVPEGDDPNDILSKDFEVQNLLGKAGLEKWEQYVALKQQIRNEADPQKKQALMAEFLQIGNAYEFPGI